MPTIQRLLVWLRHVRNANDGDNKFGTFAGVFVPTVLTILGAIMYLREGWVVGNAGLGGAILIILLAHVITVSTGLSVSSIATNIRVGAGGAFSIISQSLGLEVGGSIGVPLFLAQAISTALYIFAFTEGIQRIFPQLPVWIILYVTFLLVFIIAYTSAQFAARVQIIILIIVGFSLFSIFLGSFAIAGRAGLTYQPQMWGTFADRSFWGTFGIFFPAVTGIMAGISMSGSLKDPRRSIPRGTMTAIGLTLVVYLLLAYWLARVASPAELVNNLTIMVDKAFWAWAVLAGILGATFSSALGSLVAAPRVMQALGFHGVLPFGAVFARETEKGDPRQATIATGIIVFIAMTFALFAGGLDAIAPLITMFFLITYAMLNAVVLLEQTLGMVSFRPTLSLPRLVPFIGLISCLFVMLLTNATFSLMAIIATLGIYAYLQRRQLQTPWEDVRSGLFLTFAEWAAEMASHMPAAPERTWKPNVLVPVTSPDELVGSYRFLRAIAVPQGSIYVLGVYPPGGRAQLRQLDELTGSFMADRVFARTTLLEADAFADGVKMATEVLSSAFFRPNILFLPIPASDKLAPMLDLLPKVTAYQIGTLLFWRHPVIDLGREQSINVWLREQGSEWELGLRMSNLDLAVLLAYQISRNWNGYIRLCMVVPDEETKVRAEQFLTDLVRLSRMPASTQSAVFTGDFWAALPVAPGADLTVLGLPRQPDIGFIQRATETVHSSCIFVRDSGNESALA